MPDNTNESAAMSRSTKMVLGGVGAAALIGVLGLAVGTAAAADDETQGGQGNQSEAPADGQRPEGAGPMHGGPPSGEGQMLHGEMVVEDDSGDAVIRLAQSGEVTDVSAQSISVTSSDGFSATYVVDGDTEVRSLDAGDDGSGLDGIETGDTVRIHASGEGNQDTALAVLEAIEGAQPGA